ncbi:MAG TPA: DUF1647 domain-containing protein [Dongiaceae bacterium]
MADGRLVIVTRASQNHARPLFHLLESLDRYEPGTRVVVYDLGLRPKTARRLRRHGRNLVPFRFDDYPPHVDPHNLKTYAWKPAMAHEVLLEYGLPLLYLDAGDLVHERLDRVRQEMARIGFYSPHTEGTVAKWCYPTTVPALEIEPEVLGAQNRNGAIIGFADCPLARELAVAWYEQSMRPEVMCPPGSSRRNHRFDQTVLSVLLVRAIHRHRLDPVNTRLGISLRNDRLTRGAARRYMQCDPQIPKEVVLQDYVEPGPGPARRLWRAVKRIRRRIKRAARRLKRGMIRG